MFVVVAVVYYFTVVYKPSTAEFIELKRQEEALTLPEPWSYEATDRGHWMSSPGSGEPATISSYSRHISLGYKSTNTELLRKQFIERLEKNGWTKVEDSFKDRTPIPKDTKIYQASRDFFRKNGSEGRMCATIETEYNGNYQKESPWLIKIFILGKTDAGCPE